MKLIDIQLDLKNRFSFDIVAIQNGYYYVFYNEDAQYFRDVHGHKTYNQGKNLMAGQTSLEKLFDQLEKSGLKYAIVIQNNEDIDNNKYRSRIVKYSSDSNAVGIKFGPLKGYQKTNHSIKIYSKANEEDGPENYLVSSKKHRFAYEPWTPELDNELKKLSKLKSLSELAIHFQRQIGAIESRLKKFNKIDISSEENNQNIEEKEVVIGTTFSGYPLVTANKNYSMNDAVLFQKTSEKHTGPLLNFKIDVSRLTEREFFILKSRWGLGLRKSLTLREVGILLGISHESVRQLERKCYAKLIANEYVPEKTSKTLTTRIQSLIDGFDPFTGEFFDKNSPLTNSEVIKKLIEIISLEKEDN
jgi:DNA-binding CsgD family transcriptional regulator